MSSRKRKISLNCSLSIPSTSSTSILNTPEILDTVLNITAEQLHAPQQDNLAKTEVAGQIGNNIEIKEEDGRNEEYEMNKKNKSGKRGKYLLNVIYFLTFDISDTSI